MPDSLLCVDDYPCELYTDLTAFEQCVVQIVKAFERALSHPSVVQFEPSCNFFGVPSSSPHMERFPADTRPDRWGRLLLPLESTQLSIFYGMFYKSQRFITFFSFISLCKTFVMHIFTFLRL